MENNFKLKLILGGLGRLVLADLACLVINMFFTLTYHNMGFLSCILFGFCSVSALVIIYADFCLKRGEKVKNLVNFHGAKAGPNFGLVIGLVSVIPGYITVLLTYISKLGYIPDFFPIYKLCNLFFLPLTFFTDPNYLNEFGASTSVLASYLSVGTLILIMVLPVIIPLTTWIAFRISYNNVDVKQKIMYK